jgi:hypothetical protein
MVKSPMELLKKPYVVVSLIISFAIAVLVITFAGILFKRNMIYISPIAEVTFVHPPQPASDTINVVNRDTVGEQIGKESVFNGYLTDLKDICNVYESNNGPGELFTSGWIDKPIIVIVKTSINATIWTIGTTTFSKNTCVPIKKLLGTHIYVVSDLLSHLVSATPEHQYFTVSDLKK